MFPNINHDFNAAVETMQHMGKESIPGTGTPTGETASSLMIMGL
jgi:hypothetical protein